jgi:hypothetical protein
MNDFPVFEDLFLIYFTKIYEGYNLTFKYNSDGVNLNISNSLQEKGQLSNYNVDYRGLSNSKDKDIDNKPSLLIIVNPHKTKLLTTPTSNFVDIKMEFTGKIYSLVDLNKLLAIWHGKLYTIQDYNLALIQKENDMKISHDSKGFKIARFNLSYHYQGTNKDKVYPVDKITGEIV